MSAEQASAFLDKHFPLVGVLIGWFPREISQSMRFRRRKRAFASVFRSEISAIRDRYIELIGNDIDSLGDGMYLGKTVHIQENCFTVFETNADSLSYLPSNEAKVLVRFYLTAKRHVDSLRTYMRLYGDLSTRVEEKVPYSAQLKEEVRMLKSEAASALSVLQKY